MTYTFQESKDEIARIVKYFSTNRPAFLAAAYKEAHARQELIDPLFAALNWDVSNRQHAAPEYREVVVEDSLDIEGQKKAPDYAFRIGRDRKFFGEAKKPGVDLKKTIGPAYQLRRYAWSAKLPLSVLTDFEEFSVYDCRTRPNEKDKASVARVNYLTFAEYPDRWQEIWDIFSRDAVWSGSFDQYALEGQGRKGKSEVDTEFLKEIEGWRLSLAQNIALRNPKLTLDELTDAVQRIIDRVIFLRMAEDRGIEEYGRLDKLGQATGIYKQLLSVWRQADAKYNSGLFDFSHNGDQVTQSLTVEDKALKSILGDLYFPKSPYEFSVMPADVLGNVYEQFLGKVIRLTSAHQAKVEEKPEVKKAGGVFYTPNYIVDYVVKQTLGPAIKGKSPTELKGLRVLDPSCGSGSFLLGAYSALLDHYQDWYAANDPQKHKKAIARFGDGWQLTLHERKRILTEHIYGVDIDRQAVEVTKLSLCLRVLEGLRQLSLFEERALPHLDANIKCGNSLIEPDYFDASLYDPDTEEMRRINPFDWDIEFPSIMRKGGFNCIVGNPPYIDIVGIPVPDRAYYARKYSTFLYRSDILGVFFQRAHQILAKSGRLGFITSNTYFTSASATRLRELLLESFSIEQIIDIGGGVFSGARVDTAIFVGIKSAPEKDHELVLAAGKSIVELKSLFQSADTAVFGYKAKQTTFGSGPNKAFSVASSNDTSNLVERIRNIGAIHLGDVLEFSRGYIAYDAHRGHSQAMIEKRVFHAEQKESKSYKKELVGSDIGRYSLDIKSKLWIRFGDNLAAPRAPRYHSGPRIWVQRIRNPKLPQRLVCVYIDEHEDLAASSGLTIARTVKSDYSLIALCALMNSRFINWWYRQLFHDVNIKPADMELIPLPPTWSMYQQRLQSLSQQMHNLAAKFIASKDPSERKSTERLIASADKQIEVLVLEMYGVTPEEGALLQAESNS